MALGKSLILAFTIVIAIVASFFASPAVREFLYSTSSFKAIPNLIQQRLLKQNFSTTTSITSAKMASKRMPTYFFSHGGPDVQHNTKHPVYPVLQKMGKEITSMKPKAVVVFSAHWMAGKDEINVNNAEFTELIYDFYGFPSHFYEATYPSVGSPALATKVIQLLTSAGIKASGLSRGLDHGVWSGFSVAFDPASNPLNCPLVQVSLFHSESPAQHYALGRAVSSLRDEGIIVIGAGMSGHNLRDMRFSYGDPRPLPYSVSFDEALKVATEAAPAEREQKMAELVKRPDARQAHPWMDHLMPVYVAAGAAAEEQGKQLWTLQEGSFAWAQYRFGDVVEPGKEA